MRRCEMDTSAYLHQQDTKESILGFLEFITKEELARTRGQLPPRFIYNCKP